LFARDPYRGDAADIRSGMAEVGDKSDLNRVRVNRKNDWNARRRGFGCQSRRTAQRGYQIDPAIDQVGGKLWQASVIALSGMVFDCQVLISGEAFNFQCFVKG
jgi:hypothetical protein